MEGPMPDDNEGARTRDAFVGRLVPSAIVAMGGSQLVSYLQLDGPKSVEAKQRTALIDSIIKTQGNVDLSAQSQDKLRRTMLRIGESVDPKHPAWASMATVRAAVTLSLWQTALEVAVQEAGKSLCQKKTGLPCDHGEQRFSKSWNHFMGALAQVEKDSTDAVGKAFAAAEGRIQLRHRVVHGMATASDTTFLESQTPAALNEPMTKLRQTVIEAALEAAFDDPDPERTVHRANFCRGRAAERSARRSAGQAKETGVPHPFQRRAECRPKWKAMKLARFEESVADVAALAWLEGYGHAVPTFLTRVPKTPQNGHIRKTCLRQVLVVKGV